MRSRLFALVLTLALTAGGSVHAQLYCGRTVSFATQNVVQIRQGGSWVYALNLPNTELSLPIGPDCQSVMGLAFGQEIRGSNGTTMRMQHEPNSIAILVTDTRATTRATASGIAIVVRIDLSPRLLAQNACAVAVRLAASPGGGALTLQGRSVPASQARIISRSSRCAATPS